MNFDYFIRWFDSRRLYHEMKAMKLLRDRQVLYERTLKWILENEKNLSPATMWRLRKDLEL